MNNLFLEKLCQNYIVKLLTQIDQNYQQRLQQDKNSLLENFPLNDHEFSILEEIDLLTTNLCGYANQIKINQQINDRD